MKERKAYPQDRDGWQQAIHQGIGLSGEEGSMLYKQDAFPFKELRDWIGKNYATDFGPHFPQALLRNIHGLVDWVYGNGAEPYWPGSDDDHTA